MLPPEERLVGAQLHRYIRDKLYWVLHAPLQTGKTTFLQSWMREINVLEEYAVMYLGLREKKNVTERELLTSGIIEEMAKDKILDKSKSCNSIEKIFSDYSKSVYPQKAIILLDDVDELNDRLLGFLLSSIRSGFNSRSQNTFPSVMLLTGKHRIKHPNPDTPFNILSDEIHLSNFSRENIAHLFAQHTEETGQQITDEALDYVWEQTKGQPWLVNSLFKRATMRILGEDSSETVTIEHIKQARQQIILARETHLDSLAYRLDDAGVKKVIEILISGEANTELADTEAFRQAVDMGLVVVEHSTPQVANPIYREVLARQMTYSTQLAIQGLEWKWEKDDGSLDMERLLKEFQKFWRRHSEIWEERSKYTEAFPHLLLMAFLQRVLNGGGDIEREYAAGRGRMDLLVEYKEFKYIIEIKLIHYYESEKEVREEGLEQIVKYRDKMGASIPSYLLIFDRRNADKKKPWEERLTWETVDGITVIGV
jgi:hypothetical protein